jgi:hypothetical protein
VVGLTDVATGIQRLIHILQEEKMLINIGT